MYDSEEFRLKYNYEKKLTSNLKHNSKGFFSYLRNKRQLKSFIPNLERPDGSLTDSPDGRAEVLATSFSSVHVSEPMGPLPDFGVKEIGNNVIDDIFITPEIVREELGKLNCFKSMGPDEVHPKLLKSLSEDSSFVEAIVLLFRKCTDLGTIPKVWKTANVSALFKSGSKKDPLNYRPVSLTCIICKVYEQIIRSNLVEFLDGKICNQQHGFSRGKSCLTNLLETMDCIIRVRPFFKIFWAQPCAGRP